MGRFLISNCCGAQPHFSLGRDFEYGVYIDDNGHYHGICGQCKEHADFAQIIESSGPKYEPPEEANNDE